MRGDLLVSVAAAEPIAKKLGEIENGSRPVPFSHVIDAAQPFLVAVIARKLRQKKVVIER